MLIGDFNVQSLHVRLTPVRKQLLPSLFHQWRVQTSFSAALQLYQQLDTAKFQQRNGRWRHDQKWTNSNCWSQSWAKGLGSGSTQWRASPVQQCRCRRPRQGAGTAEMQQRRGSFSVQNPEWNTTPSQRHQPIGRHHPQGHKAKAGFALWCTKYHLGPRLGDQHWCGTIAEFVPDGNGVGSGDRVRGLGVEVIQPVPTTPIPGMHNVLQVHGEAAGEETQWSRDAAEGHRRLHTRNYRWVLLRCWSSKDNLTIWMG